LKWGIYFPFYNFDYTDHLGKDKKEISCIDGGIYLNNPVLSAIAEVREFKGDPLYNKPFLEDSEIFVLSLGTGKHNKNFNNSKTQNWGLWQWKKLLLNSMMSGSSYINDYLAERLIKLNPFVNNYFRANVFIDEPHNKLDTNRKESFEHFEDEVNSQLFNNSSFMKSLDDFIIDSKM